MKILSKITVSTIGINPKELLPQLAEGSIDVMEVMGVVTGVQTGTTSFGDFMKLVGSFEATNLLTGEVFVSGKCILPSVINDLVAGQVRPDTKFAFAFVIGIEEDDNAIGYKYNFQPLVKIEGDKALDSLRAEISKHSKEIEAPPAA